MDVKRKCLDYSTCDEFFKSGSNNKYYKCQETSSIKTSSTGSVLYVSRQMCKNLFSNSFRLFVHRFICEYGESFNRKITINILDGYVQSKKKYCTKRNSTMFQTLNEAKMAGFLDKDCSTIVDYKCDRRFYYLCQEYSTIKPSKSSCVYSRPIEAGNNLHHSTLKSIKYLIQNCCYYYVS